MVLVTKDRETKMSHTHVVPCNCAEQEWVTEQFSRDIRGLCHHGNVLLKSDQEPAILSLKRAAARNMAGIEVIPEESPVSAHAANGHVEGAIRRVAGQIRCLKDALEFQYKEPISTRHPLMAYMASHAAYLITRLGRGKGGRAAWGLSRGKSYKRRLLPFGERCMYMLVRGTATLAQLASNRQLFRSTYIEVK